MKKIIILTITLLISTFTFSQEPVFSLLSGEENNSREKIIDLRIDGIDDSYIQLRNNTQQNGKFEPCLHGSTNWSERVGLVIMGNVQTENDVNDLPIMVMTSFVDNGLGWENGGYAYPTNRHYFRIRGYDSNYGNKYLFEIDENGDVGIGTNEPKSKLEVTNGDIYINDIDKGVIMKSPDGQCWRMTVSNIGEPIFTSILCPE